MSFAFAGRPTLQDVSLEITAGTFFALLGASGSGKTTLLRLIGGYLQAGRGRIHLGERDLSDLPPERRNIGMVFQSYALFPHLTARGNVAFGLEVRGVAREERQRRVEAALDRVGLAPEARDRKPGGLSGGQQQRVALARALVIEPELLLLDEPLANLDRRLRDQVRGELRLLQRRTGVTTLLVTHDPEEALALADRVGVMAAGRLLQVGSPQEVYEQPSCPYVARLLGEVNLLRVEHVAEGGGAVQGGMVFPNLRDVVPNAVLMIRPERIALEPMPEGVSYRGTVTDVSYRGGRLLVELHVNDTPLVVSAPPPFNLSMGNTATIYIPPQAIWILPQEDPPGLQA